MNAPKVTLFEMAEAVGAGAESARFMARRFDMADLAEKARVHEAAHLTLALMALDEDASRQFIASIIKSHGSEAKLLIGLLTYHPPRPALAAEVAAA